MNLVGDAILSEEALELRPRQPRRPRPRAVRDGADVGPQAGRPGAGRGRADQARLPRRATSTRASRPRSRASPPPSAARTPRRASAPSSASAPRSGAASRRDGDRRSAADCARADPASRARTVALTGAGVSVPSGIPDFRTPGDRALGQRRPDGGRPHRRLRTRPGALLVLLPAALPLARRQAAQRAPTRRWPSSSAAACSRA